MLCKPNCELIYECKYNICCVSWFFALDFINFTFKFFLILNIEFTSFLFISDFLKMISVWISKCQINMNLQSLVVKWFSLVVLKLLQPYVKLLFWKLEKASNFQSYLSEYFYFAKLYRYTHINKWIYIYIYVFVSVSKQRPAFIPLRFREPIWSTRWYAAITSK